MDRAGIACMALLTALATASGVRAETRSSSTKPMTPPAVAATYSDIESTLGVVPQFFEVFPESALPGAWEEMKSLMANPSTGLSPKEKELVGLAVAAQVPCRYCTYYHTQMARLDGATDAEIEGAVAEAALVRHWSTYLNGTNLDEYRFRSDVDRMIAKVASAPEGQAAMAPPARPILTAQDARADAEATFGFVPTFLATFPPAATAGAWKEMKALEMSPDAPLPGRTRDLIGVAVAAQIPCRYCVYFHGEAGRQLDGLSDAEIDEAVAVAAIVRHWSTVLNGMQVDEARFRSDVDKAVKTIRTNQQAEKSARLE